jgi:hypothetical protein
LKALLILPCNPGAKTGDYFPFGAWKQAMQSLKRQQIDKRLVDFAAIDSIITRLDPRGDRETKGAIVLETEMDRVKGCDLRPDWSLFTKDGYGFLKEHARCCKISMVPLLSRYDLIVVAASVRGYKYASVRALRDIAGGALPSNAIIIDAGESPSYQNGAIRIALDLIRRWHKLGTIPANAIIRPRNIPDGSRFLARPADLPAEFIYWNQPYYMIEPEHQ